MDGDPAVESRLDGFSLIFPLPYRVGFIVTLGSYELQSSIIWATFPPSLAPEKQTNTRPTDNCPLQRFGAGASIFTTFISSRLTFLR